MANFDDAKYEGGWVWFPGDYSKLRDMPADLKRTTVKQWAVEDADNNIPAVDSEAPESYEAEIWGRAVNGCGQLISRFNEVLADCLQTLRSKNQIQQTRDNLIKSKDIKDADFSQLTPNLFSEINTMMHAQEDEIKSNFKSYLNSKRALVRFKDNESLDRDAKYPSSIVYVVGVVVLLAVGETLLNGFMFRDVADGLVGGFFTAGMFSLVNVLSGLILGFFGLRYILSRGLRPKLTGAAFFIVFGIIGIFLNFFVAHYREIAHSFDGLETLEPMKHLLASPFKLEAVEAFILLIFGFVIFIYSAYKGFGGISDKYPGYKDVDETYQNAKFDYDDCVNNLRNNIQEKFNNNRAEYEEKIKLESEMAKGAQHSLNQLNTCRKNLNVSIDQCLNEGNVLLDHYRNTVTKRRLGIHIPRFSTRLNKATLKLEIPSTEDVETLVKDIAKTALDNETVYKSHIATSFAYEKEVIEELRDLLTDFEDQVAESVHTGKGDKHVETDIEDVAST